jgi:BolA-like protein 3
MSSTMFCLNAATKAVTVERRVASGATAWRCRRTFSSQTRHILLCPFRIPSTRQLPLSSHIAVRTPLSVSRSSTADRRRTYAADASRNANTIQGTIGKGASGVGEEAQRVKERLQAPDHLNEKEKMIFEKLDGALEPIRLEVCPISQSGWRRRKRI